MAVQMTFYSNFSKRTNSTKRPTGGTVQDVVFKDGFSILGGSVSLAVNFLTASNYTAAKFDKYYYIVNNVSSIHNNYVEVSLSLDVLATYKDDIAGYTSRIERSPSPLNIGEYKDLTISSKLSYSEWEKVLMSVGLFNCYQIRTKSTNSILTYFVDEDALNSFFKNLEGIIQILTDLNNIVSVCAVPLSIDTFNSGSLSTSIGVGNVGVPVSGTCYAFIGAHTISRYGDDFLVSNIPFKYSDARRYDSSYTLPFFKVGANTVPLDPNYLKATSFSYQVNIDVTSLTASSYITASIDGVDIEVYKQISNIGIALDFGVDLFQFASMQAAIQALCVGGAAALTLPMPVPSIQIPTQAMASTRPDSYITRALTVVPQQTTALSTKTYPLFPNFNQPNNAPINPKSSPVTPKNVATSIYGAFIGATTLATTVLNYNRSPSATIPSAGGTLAESQDIFICRFILQECDSMDKRPEEFGYPFNEITNINSMNEVDRVGFYKFAGASIDVSAYDDIRDSLNSFLNNGFFYE